MAVVHMKNYAYRHRKALCGLDAPDRITVNEAKVTCKNCLRKLDAQTKTHSGTT